MAQNYYNNNNNRCDFVLSLKIEGIIMSQYKNVKIHRALILENESNIIDRNGP